MGRRWLEKLVFRWLVNTNEYHYYIRFVNYCNHFVKVLNVNAVAAFEGFLWEMLLRGSAVS
jgi:hypothetical protein